MQIHSKLQLRRVDDAGGQALLEADVRYKGEEATRVFEEIRRMPIAWADPDRPSECLLDLWVDDDLIDTLAIEEAAFDWLIDKYLRATRYEVDPLLVEYYGYLKERGMDTRSVSAHFISKDK